MWNCRHLPACENTFCSPGRCIDGSSSMGRHQKTIPGYGLGSPMAKNGARCTRPMATLRWTMYLDSIPIRQWSRSIAKTVGIDLAGSHTADVSINQLFALLALHFPSSSIATIAKNGLPAVLEYPHADETQRCRSCMDPKCGTNGR